MQRIKLPTTILFLTLFLSRLNAQYAWQKAASIPETPWAPAAFSVGGKGYIVGGELTPGGANSNKVWQYDPVADTWTQKNNFPEVVCAASSFVINDTAYVGLGTGVTGSYYAGFYRYNQALDQWDTIPNFPGASRYCAMSFVINGKAYVGCGKGANQNNDFYQYDPAINAWTSKANFPGLPRQSGFGAAIDSFGYMGFGLGNGSTMFSDCYKYNPDSDSWTPIASFPGPIRQGSSTIVINDTMYQAAGGYFETSTYSDCWRYDVTSNSWIQAQGFGCLAPGRLVMASFEINGHAYLPGGTNYNYTEFYGDLLEFGPVDSVIAPHIYLLGTDSVCTGSTVNLSSNAYCTDSTNVTYTWSSSAGTLADSFGVTNSIVLPPVGSATVTLSADNGFTITSDSIVLTGVGVGVSISNPAPVQLSCGGPAVTITALVTGNIQGISYMWSNDSTGVNDTSISASAPGQYSVTVTNGAGCSASTQVSAVYANGVSNTPSFVNTSPVCQGLTFELINTSTATTGWNVIWTLGNGDTLTSLSPTFSYDTAGTYSITLTMDSAGCYFTSAPSTVNVLPSGTGACQAGGTYTWSHKAALPSAVWGNAAFAVGNKGYSVAGGLGTAGDWTANTSQVWMYDPTSDTWTRKNNYPTTPWGVLSFVINDTAYVGLGQDSSGNFLTGFYRYDATNDQWTAIAAFPGAARYDAMCFVLNGKAYVGGGKGASEDNDFYQYDPATNTWTQKANVPGNPRSGGFGAASGNFGYMGMGLGDGPTMFSDCYKYNPDSDSWSAIGSFPVAPKDGAGCFVINDTIYVAGGTDYRVTQYSDCWRYDSSSNSWLQVQGFGCLSPGHAIMNGFTLNGKGYIAGGTNTSYTQYFNDFLQFGPVDTSLIPKIYVTSTDSGCGGGVVSLSSNAYCTDSTNVSFIWSASAGTLQYTSGATNSLTMPASGNVTVTLDRYNGVSNAYDTVVIINKGIGLSINPSPVTLNCGGSPVVVTATASGDTAGLNYLWNTGSVDSAVSINLPGSYSVTATNNAGCSVSDSVNANYINGITNSVDFIYSSPVCQDIPIDFTNRCAKTNGWNALYSMGNGDTVFSINPAYTYVDSGTYTVVLTLDSDGCAFASSPHVIDILPAGNPLCHMPLSVNFRGHEYVCHGSNVILNPEIFGGYPPYQFAWSATGDTLSCTNCEQPSAAITENSVYTITVTDAYNNTGTGTAFYSISADSAQLQIAFVSSPISCLDRTDTTSVTITGGTSPFTYNWGDGSIQQSIATQTHYYTQGGPVVITVKDANGCEAAVFDTIADQGLIVSLAQATQPSCPGSSTGQITVAVSGGMPPYKYLWNNGSTASAVANLLAGTYSVVVTDSSSCSSAFIYNLNPANDLQYYVYLNPINANCGGNGVINSEVYNGNPPYNYLWSTGDTTANDSALNSGMYKITVTDSTGCLATGTTTINFQCVNTISGMLFADLNADCRFDSTDYPLTFAYVTANGPDGEYYGYTDYNGNYSIQVYSNGTYTLQAIVDEFMACGNLTLCGSSTESVTFTSAGGSVSTNNNFAFESSTGFDLTIHPGWTSADPGFQKEYWVMPYNQSYLPFIGNATVTFTYDSNLIYQYSLPPLPQVNLAAHTLTWVVDSLPSPSWDWDNVRFQNYFMVPTTLSLGYLLQSEFTITPTAGDCDTSNNFMHFSETVIGSHDPNEKDVQPQGAITAGDSVLTYTIHFQNDGSDSTNFIIVSDTLSPNLDPTTVRNLSASYKYSSFTVGGQGVLTWTFNPYRLVDSLTNPAGSKGYITFSVKQKKNLPVNTTITNTATIYFDYNTGVTTNTVGDTIITIPSAITDVNATRKVQVVAYPNPFNSKTTVSVVGLTDKYDFELYDVTGRLQTVLKSLGSQQFELERGSLAAGVYLYKISVAGDKVAFGKLVVQ